MLGQLMDTRPGKVRHTHFLFRLPGPRSSEAVTGCSGSPIEIFTFFSGLTPALAETGSEPSRMPFLLDRSALPRGGRWRVALFGLLLVRNALGSGESRRLGSFRVLVVVRRCGTAGCAVFIDSSAAASPPPTLRMDAGDALVFGSASWAGSEADREGCRPNKRALLGAVMVFV